MRLPGWVPGVSWYLASTLPPLGRLGHGVVPWADTPLAGQGVVPWADTPSAGRGVIPWADTPAGGPCCVGRVVRLPGCTSRASGQRGNFSWAPLSSWCGLLGWAASCGPLFLCASVVLALGWLMLPLCRLGEVCRRGGRVVRLPGCMLVATVLRVNLRFPPLSAWWVLLGRVALCGPGSRRQGCLGAWSFALPLCRLGAACRRGWAALCGFLDCTSCAMALRWILSLAPLLSWCGQLSWAAVCGPPSTSATVVVARGGKAAPFVA